MRTACSRASGEEALESMWEVLAPPAAARCRGANKMAAASWFSLPLRSGGRCRLRRQDAVANGKAGPKGATQDASRNAEGGAPKALRPAGTLDLHAVESIGYFLFDERGFSPGLSPDPIGTDVPPTTHYQRAPRPSFVSGSGYVSSGPQALSPLPDGERPTRAARRVRGRAQRACSSLQTVTMTTPAFGFSPPLCVMVGKHPTRT